MSIFSEIKLSPPSEPAPRGPGKCPSCDDLEDGITPTGQCLACIDLEYAVAELEAAAAAEARVPSPRTEKPFGCSSDCRLWQTAGCGGGCSQ